MKVAICYSGQLRTGLRCLPNQRLFFGDVDADFFVHTWTSNTNKRFNKTPSSEVSRVPTHIMDAYLDTLNPKMSLVEDAEVLNLWSNGHSHTALFYSWIKSLELKREWERRHNFKYDFVVKIRPDIVFNPDRRLVNELNNAKETGGFVVENLQPTWPTDGAIDDVFWVAPNDVMEKASTFYSAVFVDKTTPMHLGNYLASMGVPIVPNKEFFYAIYRKECEPLDAIKQFWELREKDWHYFGIMNGVLSPGWEIQPHEKSDYYL